MRPSDTLLEGPVGRAFLARLAGLEPYEVVEAGALDELHQLIGDRASSRLPEVARTSGAALMQELGEVTQGFAFGASSLWRQVDGRLSEARGHLEPMALALADRGDLAWWWEGVGHEQVVVRDTRHTAHLAHHDQSDAWWVSPWYPGVTRSTGAPDGLAGAVALFCHDGHVAPAVEYATWSFIPRAARVLEIGTSQDWCALVARHPRPRFAQSGRRRPRSSSDAEMWASMTGVSGPWFTPDWSAVASEHDAVHVSVAAWLATAYRALPVDGGWTALIGWNPDETVWFG